MTSRKTTALASMLGATALVFTLSLTGCGQKAESTDAAATETQTNAETGTDAAGTVTLPTEATEMTAVVDKLVTSNDTSGAEQFASIPKESDAQLEELEGSDELDEGADEASKAPTGSIRLMGRGVQMLIPDSWVAASTVEGIQFLSADNTISGCMIDYDLAEVEGVDVETLAQSIPQGLIQSGYQNVRIVEMDTGYSESGTACASSVCVAVTINGTDYVDFRQFVKSKSYLTMIEIFGAKTDFATNIDAIEEVAESVQFNLGEAV